MPYMYETEGPLIRRFIWWKLRYEYGRWSSFTLSNGKACGTFWYKDDAKPQQKTSNIYQIRPNE